MTLNVVAPPRMGIWKQLKLGVQQKGMIIPLLRLEKYLSQTFFFFLKSFKFYFDNVS